MMLVIELLMVYPAMVISGNEGGQSCLASADGKPSVVISKLLAREGRAESWIAG